MSQITHKNHYVPQFYLKNWSNNGQTIWTYNILVSDNKVPLWRELAISSTATLKDFYTIEINETENDDIEKWFNKDFEIPAKIAIDKVKKNVRLTKDAWQALSDFAAVQFLRTPANLNKFIENKKIESNISKKSFNEKKYDIKKNNYISRKTNYPVTNTELVPIKVTHKGDKEYIVSYIWGKGTFLFSLKHLLTNTIKVLREYKWHIINASNEIEWMTSDDPVICLNFYNKNKYDFNGGWGKKGCEILFPLTPKHMLYTMVGGAKNIQMFNNSKEYSELAQKLIIEHSYRYLCPIKGMSFVRPRTIDSVLFKHEKETLDTWHENQINAEKEFLK